MIASDLLNFDCWSSQDTYVDVAACNSPWAKTLRERTNISSFAIDLAPVPSSFSKLAFYRTENAANTTFADSSVRGASLQSAFEMFLGDHDKTFMHELSRILCPGGKAIILLLYLHTHYC